MEEYKVAALLLSVAYLMIGGGYIIYIYDSYRRTSQRFLLVLSFGLFMMIVGGVLPILAFVAELLDKSIVIVAIVFQIIGISTVFYSTAK
ncbi:MAG: hypothetical protein ABWW66_03095 [Archaeoglobaceae archaeon]